MRFTKVLFMLAIVVVAIAGGAVVGIRMGRQKFGAPVEIKPSFYGVKSAGGIYLYGARTSKGVMLFDTGMDPEARPVDGLLAALGTGRDDVHNIFLTHGHFDHVAGVGQFPKAQSYLGAGDTGLAAGDVSPDALAAQIMARVIRNPGVKVTSALRGATTIDVGDGKTVKAFPVPGHTAGSYAFLYDGVLLCGDMMILKEGRLEPTPTVFDAHPAENRQAIRSLKTQLAGETMETICTAHGGCTPKGLGSNLLDDLIARIGAAG